MISELFAEFAALYPALSSGKFEMSEKTDILRKLLPERITQLAAIPPDYRVYSSVGQGQWAEIPWLAILDRDITESTQKGYYVVFLYSADCTEIFLSLAVGWEQYEQSLGIRDGRIAIENTVRQLQRILRSPLSDFSFEKRGLNATKTLGKGYESGGICHKAYQVNSMPSDEVIINDLRNIIGVYRELKGLVGRDVLNLEIPEAEAVTAEFSKKVIQASERATDINEAKRIIKELTKDVEQAPAAEKTKLARYIARNRRFAELVKQAANYVCEICGCPPFETKSGGKYAEAHHTLELATHRIDHPEVMICVCAQCHRVITYGTEAELEKRRQLKSK